MARDSKNKYFFINFLKILSPVLFALFILLANIISHEKNTEGTYTILNNEDYVTSFVKDTASAKDNITCALFMYKIDDYNMDNMQEPLPLITASLVNAASRGVNVTMILENSDDEDDLSNKYHKKTAAYLKENNINVVYDNKSRKLHAKVCLIDDYIIYTGSHNFTYSAMARNSESSVKIVSFEEAEKIKEYFKKIQ